MRKPQGRALGWNLIRQRDTLAALTVADAEADTLDAATQRMQRAAQQVVDAKARLGEWRQQRERLDAAEKDRARAREGVVQVKSVHAAAGSVAEVAEALTMIAALDDVSAQQAAMRVTIVAEIAAAEERVEVAARALEVAETSRDRIAQQQDGRVTLRRVHRLAIRVAAEKAMNAEVDARGGRADWGPLANLSDLPLILARLYRDNSAAFEALETRPFGVAPAVEAPPDALGPLAASVAIAQAAPPAFGTVPDGRGITAGVPGAVAS